MVDVCSTCYPRHPAVTDIVRLLHLCVLVESTEKMNIVL